MLRGELALPSRSTGLVIRPRRGGVLGSSAAAVAAGEEALPHHPGSATADETLVFFSDRIHTLDGGSGARPFGLGPQLRLTDAGSHSLHRLCDSTPCAVYEPSCRSVLFVEGYAVMRLDGRNRVWVLAGSPADCAHADGPPAAARFSYIRALTADGRGNVYVAESQCIRKLTLAVEPAAADAASGGGDGGGGGGGSQRSSRSSSWSGSTWLTEDQVELDVHGNGGGGAGGGGSMAVSCTAVTTLDGCAPPRERWVALAYDAASACLLAATDTAVFRLPQPSTSRTPPDSPTSPAAPALAAPVTSRAARYAAMAAAAGGGRVHVLTGGAALPHPTPQLLAGDPYIRGHSSGRGAAVRFYAISAMLATGDGGVYIADGGGVRELDVRACEVRGALREGSTRCEPACMAVLPQGCMAIAGSALHPHVLEFFGLGFRAAAPPPPPGPPLSSSSPSLGSYTASLRGGGCGGGGASGSVSSRPRLCRELLLAEPRGGGGGTAAGAMVVVRVGGLRLAAHRAVLTTGSDYFTHLLDGGFLESSRLGAAAAADADDAGADAVLELPEADPDAFAALLCYLYTGRLEVPEPLLRPTAELAGRLLMADACAELQRRLLAGATPETVVADLVWAERHNLGELMEGLATYFVENCRRVATAEAAVEALRGLAEGSPGLAARLLLAVSSYRW